MRFGGGLRTPAQGDGNLIATAVKDEPIADAHNMIPTALDSRVLKVWSHHPLYQRHNSSWLLPRLRRYRPIQRCSRIGVVNNRPHGLHEPAVHFESQT